MFNCKDKQKIENIFSNPNVYQWITDDNSKDFAVILHPNIIYLMNDTEDGVIRIDPMNSVTCQVHIAVLPSGRQHSKQFVYDAFNWAYKNTLYQKFVGIIPSFNTRTIRFVENIGFTYEGTLTQSFMKDWELHDQLIYSVNKGDNLCLL